MPLRVHPLLWPDAGVPSSLPSRVDGYLAPDPPTVYDGWLGLNDIYYGPPIVKPAFPTQYGGLRIQLPSGVRTLCLVAVADAPSGVGGQLRFQKNGTTYVVYLVTTADINASPLRIRTSVGTVSIRNKT